MPSRDVGFNALNTTDYALAAGSVRVMPLPVRGTQDIDAITVRVNTTNAGAKMKGLIFARNAATGRPGALLHTSDEVTGVTAGIMVLPFTVKPSLANGLYFFGVISDTAINLRGINGANINLIDATGSYAAPASPFDAAAAVQTTRVSLGYRYTSNASEYAYVEGNISVTGWATANRDANRKDVFKFTPTHGETVDRITYIWAGNSNLAYKSKLVIYAHDAGTNQPGALLATSDEMVGWPFGVYIDYTFAAPFTFVAGTTYWIGHFNESGTPTMYYLDAVGEARSTTWDAYADGPVSPFSASGGIGNDDFWLPISYQYTPAPGTAGLQPWRRQGRMPRLGSGGTMGWTVRADNNSQFFSTVTGGTLQPANGDLGFLTGNDTAGNYLDYEETILEAEYADVDAGTVTAHFWFYGTTLDADDRLMGQVVSLDAMGVQLGIASTGEFAPNSGGVWNEYGPISLLLPAYTRRIRWTVFGRKQTGTLSDRRNAIGSVRGYLESAFADSFVTKQTVNYAAGLPANEAMISKMTVNYGVFPQRKSSFVMILD